MRITRNLAVFLAALTSTAALAASPGAVYANDSVAVQKRTMTALAQADSLIISAAPTVSDADSVAQNDKVDVPVDPRKGVTLRTTDGKSMIIGLPNASKLDDGVRLSSGAVLYRGRNGSDVVVIPSPVGAQFLTIINDENAPTDYSYPAGVPQGGKTALSDDGSAVVLDAKGAPVAVIAPAWAVDAKRQEVPTKFISDGATLTQHIAHKNTGVAYPVVADPTVSYGWINYTMWYSKSDVRSMADQSYWYGITTTAVFACGRIRNWALAGACTGAFSMAGWWIDKTFEEAKNTNQCVWISISYAADLDGWGRYRC